MTTTTTTTTKAEDELARRRIEEEMKQIQQETKEKRQKAMRALIGDTAEDVEERKQGVGQSIKRWMGKGSSEERHANPSSSTRPSVAGIEDVVNARKLAYAQNLKEIADKGKTHFADDDDDDDDDQAYVASYETKRRFEKPSFGVPSLFGGPRRGASKQQQQQQTKPDPESDQPQDYRSEFASIETEEATIVGNEKHIKITGINHKGRKITKIKIILPQVRAETVPQHQNKGSATSAKDGLIYYSLADIRKGTVKSKGFDKTRKEEYLSPGEFQEVFDMTKEDFAALPKWKRDKVKRQLGLF